ncbi:MAG: beta-Ala-His dipeptidase [Chitinivibrionales bacterium]|nr:beta-Ala-His dipeptidase [Chitinivibrionales bacterium]MBD3397425.1 beta-Ala-His dipeptidase [Chitinivibrionales bacterium]
MHVPSALRQQEYRMNPEKIWEIFDGICAIPRCSGSETAVAAYILDYARQNGCAARKDARGNVCVDVPASGGCENTPPLVIQTHLDMVCEKNAGVQHDFAADPVKTETHGRWLCARGTTLGADNGIGVACALACIDAPHMPRPPLELLFTVEEETGLRGAACSEPGFITGKRLLNLDSEELGAVYVGCAGGSCTRVTFAPEWIRPPEAGETLDLAVSGLNGGHSGIDIHRKRGNAIVILAQVLDALAGAVSFSVADISGGNKLNAIPREARARIVAGPREHDRIERIAAACAADVRARLPDGNNGMVLSVNPVGGATPRVLDRNSRERLIRLLRDIPHGVLAVSRDIPGLVTTSNNLATAGIEGERLVVGTMARSSSLDDMRSVETAIAEVAGKCGAAAETGERYPGWEPDLGSPLLRLVMDAYEHVQGVRPEAKAIHAGLECGILGERLPGLDMASIGPTIEGAHSPGERVDIESVAVFWDVLRAVLERSAARA